MLPAWLHLLLSLLSAVSGLAIGYGLFANRTTEGTSNGNGAAPDSETTQQALARLQAMATQVGNDVSTHNQAIQRISSDLSENRCDPAGALAQLMEANHQMEQQLAEAESRLQEQAREIDHHISESRTDALTGLPNRRAFDEIMQQQAKRLRDSGTPAVLMMMDIDHFKQFNDTYGHLAGDEVLQGVANAIRRQSPDTVMATRFGGEEFSIIFPGMNIEETLAAADQIRTSIKSLRFEFEGQQVQVSASGGLAQLQPGESIQAVITRADEGLYVSKQAGRDCSHWHDGTQIVPLNSKPADATAADAQPPSDQHESDQAGSASPEETSVDLASLKGLEEFMATVDQRIAHSRDTDTPISAMVMTVDDLQSLTEQHGPDTRQRILQCLLRTLQQTIRVADNTARVGDDSLIALLPGASLELASRVAERLRAAVAAASDQADEEPLRFTVSVGVAQHEDHAPPMVKQAVAGAAHAAENQGNLVAISDGEAFRFWKQPIAMPGGVSDLQPA